MRRVQVCPLQSWTGARYGPRARITSLLPGEEPGRGGSRGRWGRRRNFSELLCFQGWVSHLGPAAAVLRLTWLVGLAAFRVQSTAREKWPQQLSCFKVQGQRSPHETKHVDLELPITSHSLWGAAAALPPWPGSCHSLRVTGRSSSTSPASSLPAQGKTTSYPPPEASETTISNASLHPFIRVSPQCHHFSTQRSPTTSFQETPSAKRIVQERSGQSL